MATDLLIIILHVFGGYVCVGVVVAPQRFDTALYLEGVSEDVMMSLNDTAAQNLSSVEEMRAYARESTLGLQAGAADYRRRWHWGGRRDKYRACYSISSVNLGAIYELRDYFQMRILYSNTMEYEIGYLTHEIIYKYGLMLEMFKLVTDKMEGPLEKTRAAPSMYVFYMYTYIVDQAKMVALLVNMLRLVEDKYRRSRKKGVFDNDEIVERERELKEAQSNPNVTVSGANKELKAQQEYLKRLKKERKRLLRLEREKNKAWAKFSPYSSTRRTTPWNGSFPLIYGWSIEDW